MASDMVKDVGSRRLKWNGDGQRRKVVELTSSDRSCSAYL